MHKDNLIFKISRMYRRRQWHPTPVLLPGRSHGWRSLLGCSPWGREESYWTARFHFHFSLSCVGEGNGNPLQCSCLESPRDGGGLVGCRLWGRAELDTTEMTWQQHSKVVCIHKEREEELPVGESFYICLRKMDALCT